MLDLSWFLMLASFLFTIGLFGLVFARRNFVVMLMAIELMLLASNLLLAASSVNNASIDGHVFVLFSLTVTAAEAAIGLAIFIVYFRQKTSIQADHPHTMHG